MIEAHTDTTNKLLRISFSGHVTVAESRDSLKRLQALLMELQTGFRLLTDLSGLELMDQDCVPQLKTVMDHCNAKGVSLIVRVIPDPHKDIGFNILSLFHYRHNIRIVTCETLTEAEQALRE
jgi:anti-anti-sigma regulatory factor